MKCSDLRVKLRTHFREGNDIILIKYEVWKYARIYLVRHAAVSRSFSQLVKPTCFPLPQAMRVSSIYRGFHVTRRAYEPTFFVDVQIKKGLPKPWSYWRNNVG